MKMELIKLFSMFSGYGGAEFALKKVGIPFKCVGYSEIDKNAIKCYNQNHPNIKNYGDCKKINPEDLPDFNLLTGGFPCQAFSIAGKRDGAKGKTGSLFNEIIRIIKVKQPTYLLLENVRGILSMPFQMGDGRNTYHDYVIHQLRRAGYGVSWKVLNSKHHGIPQNRERVWYVCKLGGWEFMEFQFPFKEKLTLSMLDLLESKEDIQKNYEKPEYFYLTDHQRKMTLRGAEKRNRKLAINESVSRCLTTGGDKRHIHDCNIIIHNFAPRSGNPKQGGTGYLSWKDGVSYCLDTSKTEWIESKKIKPRILTPKERFRLMGFLNDEINLEGLSMTACNNLSGNGWDISVVSKIFKKMFKGSGGYFSI